MTETELKSRLQKKYNHSTWKELLTSIFSKVDYFIHPTILAEKTEKAKSVRQIGNLSIADGNIGIFEVEVSSRKNITRNRVELRKIAAAYIDQDIINGAFVFYYASNQNDYRFTFIAKKSNLTEEGELVNYQTPPKRYTYVLGPNESCTTAAKRLTELEHSENISLDNVIQAFSLEKLNKEFFKKYKEHYQKLCDELAHSGFRKSVFNLQNFKDKKENDKAEKPIRDFVKLLLGRIVFLHFLQKKRWLGCPANSETWKEGDFQFLYNLYTDYKDKDHFLSKCLNRLFFDTLNTNRDGDIFEFTKTRVPYLNGGLFDNVHPDYEQIDFPAIRFEELFDFFSQYNFTIDESSPDEHEVGIDPEMLSHIFENLLEDNKDKGAFYTPKEIVHYMCHESLIQYLKTNLNGCHSDSDLSDEGSKAVEAFIHNQEVSQFIRDNAKEIDSLLDKVKICDPAIGSGAFPMGMLKEIFQAKLLLYPYLKTNKRFDPALVKRNIIQNSIYGVDIDSGAVDIARLRFWLALIVDEEEPTPLPNLDYKIMQGNSLLESFEGIDLSHAFSDEFKVTLVDPQINIFSGNVEDPQYQVNFTPQQKMHIKDLAEKYFKETDKVEKVKLHNSIEDHVLNHIELSLEFHKNKKTILLEQTRQELKERIKPINKLSARKQYLTKNKLLLMIEQLRNELKEIDSKYSKLKAFEETPERPYFLWHFYFKDVFDNGGFDIVIGNPPYIGEKGYTKLFNELKVISKWSEFYRRRSNLYYFFMRVGIDISVDNGVIVFITPREYLTADWANKLRKYIIDNVSIISFCDFEYEKVFDSVNTSSFISVFKKCINNKKFLKYIKSKVSDFHYYNFHNILLNNSREISIDQLKNAESPWYLSDQLKTKQTNIIKLGSIFSTSQGIVTGVDKVTQNHIDKGLIHKDFLGRGIFILRENIDFIRTKDKILLIHKNSNSFLEVNQVERVFVKKFISSSQLKQWTLLDSNEMFINTIENLSTSSSIYKYLFQFKEILINRSLINEKQKVSFDDFLKMDNNKVKQIYSSAGAVQKIMRKKLWYLPLYQRSVIPFDQPKIIVNTKGMDNFTFVREEVYSGGGGRGGQNYIFYTPFKDLDYSLQLKKYSNIDSFLRFINCVLNSTYIKNYIRNNRFNQLSTSKIEDLPIYKIRFEDLRDKKYYDSIVNLSNKIMSSENINSKLLQDEINILVYKLYNLTYEEVKIIDPNIEEIIGKEEYERFSID